MDIEITKEVLADINKDAVITVKGLLGKAGCCAATDRQKRKIWNRLIIILHNFLLQTFFKSY